MTKYASITIQAIALSAAVAVRTLAVESESGVAVIAEEGVPGGAIVAAQQITATVEAVAADTRKVTLVMADGKKSDYTAGPAVANFNQIKAGDQIKVTALQAIAVALRKGDEPAEDSAAAGVALAPLGDKPGMLIGDAVAVHATVKALDTEARTATLEMPDGSTKTVQVRADVDMSKAAIGDKVAIKLVEALAISVQAP
jgi:hypothetical protein